MKVVLRGLATSGLEAAFLAIAGVLLRKRKHWLGGRGCALDDLLEVPSEHRAEAEYSQSRGATGAKDRWGGFTRLHTTGC